MTWLSRAPEVVPRDPVNDLAASQPVRRAVRRMLTGELKRAEAACRRLKDPTDAEALHDFRVALRRLRSLARAYKPHVEDSLPVKLRRRVKLLVSNTGSARDLEAQMAWLQEQCDQAGARERAGYRYLIRRLESRLEADYRDIRKTLPRRFKRLHAHMVAQLALDPDDNSPPLGEVAAELVLQAGEELIAHLEQVSGRSDEEEIHRARITAKRLRYLLEPLVPDLDNGRELIKALKVLQEIMGDLRDSQLLGRELSQAAAEAGAAHLQGLVERGLRSPHDAADLQPARGCKEAPGLVKLAHELQGHERDLIDRLLASVGEENLDRLRTYVRAAAKTLRRRAGPAGTQGGINPAA